MLLMGEKMRKAAGKVPRVESIETKQGGHEILASGIKTSEQDDSLAIEHSILRRGDLALETVQRPTSRLLLWVLNVVALFLACIVVPYRRWVPCVVPEEKLGRPQTILDRFMRRVFVAMMKPVKATRQLVGPYSLNCFLGWIIHSLVKTIREGVTTPKALDGVYTAQVLLGGQLKKWWRISPLRLHGTLLAYFIMSTVPPAAVRNRLRTTYVQALLPELEHNYRACWRETIEVLVLACGSAEAEVVAIHQFLQCYPKAKLRVKLVDLSESSLRRAKRLAESLGVEDSVVCIKADLKTYIASLPNDSVRALEIVGFFDYRTWDSLVCLCREIRRVMAPNGMFLSAHIAPTPWDFMLRYLIGWPELVHRTREEFGQAFSEGGWCDEEREYLEYEPLRGHVVAVYRRGGRRQ